MELIGIPNRLSCRICSQLLSSWEFLNFCCILCWFGLYRRVSLFLCQWSWVGTFNYLSLKPNSGRCLSGHQELGWVDFERIGGMGRVIGMRMEGGMRNWDCRANGVKKVSDVVVLWGLHFGFCNSKPLIGRQILVICYDRKDGNGWN